LPGAGTGDRRFLTPEQNGQAQPVPGPASRVSKTGPRENSPGALRRSAYWPGTPFADRAKSRVDRRSTSSKPRSANRGHPERTAGEGKSQVRPGGLAPQHRGPGPPTRGLPTVEVLGLATMFLPVDFPARDQRLRGKGWLGACNRRLCSAGERPRREKGEGKKGRGPSSSRIRRPTGHRTANAPGLPQGRRTCSANECAMEPLAPVAEP